MLLSDRQRLVAEVGVLTLLGWMAGTLAFDTRGEGAGARATAVASPRTARASAEPASMSEALPREPEPVAVTPAGPGVALTPISPPAATGTVIRMGEGVDVVHGSTGPEPCLTRSVGGATKGGPVP